MKVNFREKGVALVLGELGGNVQVEKHHLLREILILNMGSLRLLEFGAHRATLLSLFQPCLRLYAEAF